MIHTPGKKVNAQLIALGALDSPQENFGEASTVDEYLRGILGELNSAPSLPIDWEKYDSQKDGSALFKVNNLYGAPLVNPDHYKGFIHTSGLDTPPTAEPTEEDK